MPFRKSLPWIGSLLLHSVIVVIPIEFGDLSGLFPSGKALDFSLEQFSQGLERGIVSSAPAVVVPKKPFPATSEPVERAQAAETEPQPV
jgi:hypothetical protein